MNGKILKYDYIKPVRTEVSDVYEVVVVCEDFCIVSSLKRDSVKNSNRN